MDVHAHSDSRAMCNRVLVRGSGSDFSFKEGSPCLIEELSWLVLLAVSPPPCGPRLPPLLPIAYPLVQLAHTECIVLSLRL